MTPNSGSSVTPPDNRRRPRDMTLVSVSLISLSLIWAGTHQLGRAMMDGRFYRLEWLLGVGLLIAGGFLFTTLVIPVDIRRRLDIWTFLVLGGVPLVTLAYTLYSTAGGEIRVLDKLLGWAVPYGSTALAVVVGFAGAAAFRVTPPTPTPSIEQATLTQSD